MVKAPSSRRRDGWIPSYALIICRATYGLEKSVDLFARVVNVLDKQYSTAGFLTPTPFNPNALSAPTRSNRTHENAVSPGTPRAVWAGVRVHFD